MDTCVQNQNMLPNYYHAEDINATVSYGDWSGKYEVLECDINTNLGTTSEANTGEFSLGDNA